MAQFLAVFLIFTHVFVVLAMANQSEHIGVEPTSAEPPVNRKFGKHQPKKLESAAAPCLSPSKGPETENKVGSPEEFSFSDQKSEKVQEIHIPKHHHSSVDKSIAGGGVILGGLATTFLVAVFCYIRATGRKNTEPNV